ncbi:MAG: DNA mismatch repair protein MutS [Pseudomonadota bacterium]
MNKRTVPATDNAAARQTPMMAQYLQIKEANPDCLLFYRMGDFYELFFEDAEIASRALNITLTRRGKHKDADIPMCGVPVHAADDYLQRLIAQGHRVAVCEQLEDPSEAKKRGYKAVVRRDVVRLVTPGTITEDSLLAVDRNNFLCAVTRMRGAGRDGAFGIAWTDMSTGLFQVTETGTSGLGTRLSMIDASEIILPEALYDEDEIRLLVDGLAAAVAPMPAAFFDGATAESRLQAYYGVKALAGFGSFSRAELGAASAIVAYMDKTQLGENAPLDPPRRETATEILAIDPATRASLEIMRTLSGERKGSLFHAIDRTVTGPGARRLAERLNNPSCNEATIAERLEAAAHFHNDPTLTDRIRSDLKAAPDIARAFARLALNRGGPRDMITIRVGLDCAATVLATLSGAATDLPNDIAAAQAALAAAPSDLSDRLAAALADDVPLLKRDGNFVRSGFNADLDDVRALRDESRGIIAGLQADYAALAEIRALKVRHNNVLGYFVEVPAGHADRMMADPLNATFIHRQTLANAVRFSTTELSGLEAKIASAGERALAIEFETFEALRETILAGEAALKAIAGALADLDLMAALAALALERGYCRPKIDNSRVFRIEGGRHPVVEQALAQEAKAFVANDCDLGPPTDAAIGEGGCLWLVTGPNMAGKSTFLRQNALIVLLAQIGSYVPARSAHVGVVDRLFSRVGAADDLARGRSTFMVEMVETAAILNQATERSLVILDEIGRGTATFDGLSIAWAAVEHLHEVNRSRALFATHYHELTSLTERLPRVRNATVKVKEWKGDLVFLHEIAAGAADRSYGIQVAKLAGLPASVIGRAEEVLHRLEETDRSGPAALVDDLPLFSAARARNEAEAAALDPEASALRAAVDELAPDDMTPREALEVLYRLKGILS